MSSQTSRIVGKNAFRFRRFLLAGTRRRYNEKSGRFLPTAEHCFFQGFS